MAGENDPGVMAGAASEAATGAAPPAAAESSTTGAAAPQQAPGAATAPAAASGATEGSEVRSRAQDRIRQLVAEKNANEQRFAALEASHREALAALEEQRAISGKLRDVFVPPQPAEDEYLTEEMREIKAMKAEREAEKAELDALKAWRDEQKHAQLVTQFQAELAEARKRWPVPDWAVANVMHAVQSSGGKTSIADAVKTVSAGVKAYLDAEIAKTKAPPPSLLDARAPVLPSDWKPKNIAEAHAQMLRMQRG